MHKALGRFSAPRVLLYVSVEFIVLITLAMILFRGGSHYDVTATHYSFNYNFLSDLGATHVYAGTSNLIASTLFFVSLISLGGALIYFASATKLFNLRNRSKTVVEIASIDLVLAGLCFIGIALMPWDKYLSTHMLLIKLAFSFMLIYSFSTLLIQTKNHYPKRYWITNLIYLLLLIAYIGILFQGPDLGTVGGLQFQAMAQKSIFFVTIINLAYQARGVLKVQRQHQLSR